MSPETSRPVATGAPGRGTGAQRPGAGGAGARPDRPPPWRDVGVLRAVAQMVFLVAVGALLWWLWSNLRTNLASSGITTSFNYLDRPGGFDIRGSDYRPSQAIRAAIAVGLVNTIRVSATGICLALLIGTLVGIARLSPNWLLRRSAALYVETLRNIPVLVIIIFMYSAVLLRLPAITEAIELLGLGVFSNRSVGLPWVETAGDHAAYLGFLALGGPVRPSCPALEGRLIIGGVQLAPAFAALLTALTLYTASHIAEIVRGSIQAVPKGQTEAANAIALSSFQRLRYVVLPQAFRIAVPPLSNQFLNLIKNSSLAAFIGFPEMVTITNTIISNGNPAPQSIAVLMAAYLVLALSISLVTNLVNRSLALEAR